MRILETLQRAAGKSPAYLARRAAREITGALGAGRVRRRLERETAADVARRAGASSLRELWRAGSARNLVLSQGERDELRSLYATRFSAERRLLKEDLERVLSHTFDLLGSGLVRLGTQIDWHLDFKSGHRYPADVPSQSIDYVQLDRPSDVKVPWELSRGQHLTRLGQAWVIERDPRAPREFEAEVRSWIASNPPGLGVNWACTMDVALRAVSWIWALALFEDAPLSDAFREDVLHALYRHGIWIPGHLELGEVNGNHFLSDIVGMIALGTVFDATPEGRRWLEQGARLLEAEILEQTTPDGVGIEGSVPYHRLVLDLFLVGRRFLQSAGRVPSAVFDERLVRMLEFVEAYTTPEGLSPVVGDADDGRALALGREDIRDHRAHLSTGAVLFGRESFKARAERLSEETVWVLGPAAAAAFDRLAPAPPSGTGAFADAGFFVLRSHSQYLFVDAGPVGFRGLGGHGHNDCLSFEWHAFGRPVLTDSGAYVYTSSHEWRNRFRGTGFHNAIRVDGEEINRFPSELALWSLRNDAVPFDVSLLPGAETDVLSASHTGYRRLADPVTVTRRFSFDRSRAHLVLSDRLDGAARHRLEFLFHVAPGGAGNVSPEGTLVVRWLDGLEARIAQRSGIPLSWRKEAGFFSPSYGVRVERETWIASVETPLPFLAEWDLVAISE